MKINFLTLSEREMQEYVSEYVFGTYDHDPDLKSEVADMIIDSPAAQIFYKKLTKVLNSKTDQEWKDNAEKSLQKIKARLKSS